MAAADTPHVSAMEIAAWSLLGYMLYVLAGYDFGQWRIPGSLREALIFGSILAAPAICVGRVYRRVDAGLGALMILFLILVMSAFLDGVVPEFSIRTSAWSVGSDLLPFHIYRTGQRVEISQTIFFNGCIGLAIRVCLPRFDWRTSLIAVLRALLVLGIALALHLALSPSRYALMEMNKGLAQIRESASVLTLLMLPPAFMVPLFWDATIDTAAKLPTQARAAPPRPSFPRGRR